MPMFRPGALFGAVASVLVILAYGLLHARRSPRAEVSVAAPTPPAPRVAKIPPRPVRLELGIFGALPWPRL
jgi:hypothetical protein